MIEQKFGPRRCRDSRKPPAEQCPDVAFYRCAECGALFVVSKGDSGTKKEISCCGKMAEFLLPVTERGAEEAWISYKITGGYNDNAVRVFWKSGKLEYRPEWIYLKTFTGGYLKYVAESKRAPMVFALADTDAFAYCDEDPCLECVFRCKRGFVIYAYFKEMGLIEVPIDKMTPHWQSGEKEGEAGL